MSSKSTKSNDQDDFQKKHKLTKRTKMEKGEFCSLFLGLDWLLSRFL